MNSNSKVVEVLNLATGAMLTYVGISPEEAVIAAHAQSRKDYATWMYQERYGSQLRHGKVSVGCGDHAAMK